MIAELLAAAAALADSAPAEPVTRFRTVEGYTVRIKVRSEENMRVDERGIRCR